MHVYTTSGVHVGKVVDFSIDVDTGVVIEYVVKHRLLSTIIIARERVIKIEEDKMIVEDRVLADVEEQKIKISLNPSDAVSLIED